ncbi:Ca2+-binding EF-hand superfamily protein [Agrobacterium vitis]|nr:Ca2+-binding EF-hand superfamily protein [Agrobacterium vitis]MBE1437381.1 Ca2+-binding EF-hand superfamily protein [Agrobacterium vitis]
MNAKKTTIAALAATLLVSASYGAVFAKDGKKSGEGPRHGEMADACGPRPMMMRGPAAMFIFALQQFDSNKDGKISKDEVKATEESLFTAIDTNKDGVLTPGELKKYREARMEAWKADMPKPPRPDAAEGAGKPPAPDDASAPPPPPPGDDDAMMGPMDGCGPHGADRGPKEHGRAMHEAMRGGPDGGPRGGPDGHRHRPMMGMMGPKLMAMVDTDENGQISKAEADAALDKLFTRLDTNKDGFISADDFPVGPKLLP